MRSIILLFLFVPTFTAMAALPAPSIGDTLWRGTVIAEQAELRETPSATARSVTIVRRDALVDVLDSRAGWFHVRTAEGREGWLQAQHLRTERIAMVKPAAPVEAPAQYPSSAYGSGGMAATPARAAQRARFLRFGVEGGAVMAGVRGADAPDERDARVSFHLGALMRVNAWEDGGVQLGLAYTRKGAVLGDAQSRRELRLDYLELPLHLLLLFPYNAYGSAITVGAGPFAGWLLNAAEVPDEGTVREISDIEQLDYGISAFLGVDIPAGGLTMIVQGRVAYSLAQLHDDADARLDLRGMGLLLSLGVIY